MDPLGDPLTTLSIQMGWEFTIDPYQSWRFGFIDNHDHQFGNGSVWTRTRTQSEGPEPLLPLLDIVLVAFQEISCRIPSMTFNSHEPNSVELLSKMLVYEFEHITKKGRMSVMMISFLTWVSWDQRCSEIPLSIRKKMDIRGLHSAEGYCQLQYF